MSFGRISGAMLQDSLDRQGVDLQFITNNSPLLYLSFSEFLVGIANLYPTETLTINGNLSTSNIKLNNNVISTTTANQDLFLSPAGTGNVQLGNIGQVKIAGGGANYIVTTDGNGNLSWQTLTALTTEFTVYGNNVVLGSNTAGSFSSNAATFTSGTTVTNGIAQLNYVLGKLIPPSPPNFPNGTSISISSTSTARMCNFTQTDNTAWGNLNVSGGTTVSTIRTASTYTTSAIANVGPGTNGTVTAYLNGVPQGNVTLTGSNSNTTNGNIYVYNVEDYHAVVSTVTAGFWSVFSTYATGTVAPGWNQVYIYDSGVPAQTNTTNWYYDSSSPGTPTFSNTAISLSSNVVIYSSTIPHLTSSAGATLTFSVNKLSGDTYPTVETFTTGTAGGAFQAPASVTYSAAGISEPLARNYLVSSGTTPVTTTANIISGFGSSSVGPYVNVNNGYNLGQQQFNPGVTILYKTGTSNSLEETDISVNASVGGGSGYGYRITNPDIGVQADTPSFAGTESAFNSQTGTFYNTDATVVAGLMKFDLTNYSTGYWPVGPNLSARGTTAQYFTFKFVRTAVSKFNIQYTGTIAGLWVALPGISPTYSGLNGWYSMGTAYAGSGIPGTGTGGNGSNGCAVGGNAVFNSLVTNGSYTATFGTVNSSTAGNLGNEIYVRIKLTSGQSLSAISIQAPTN